MKGKRDYINIPIALMVLAFRRKMVNPFRTFIYLKNLKTDIVYCDKIVIRINDDDADRRLFNYILVILFQTTQMSV